MQAKATRSRISPGVWTLGLVSLFTDMGSEIVHSLLPLLLAGSLGASALVIGLIEGAAEALVLITKVFSGYLSDVWGRRKPLVLLGYGLAAACKPLFPLADSITTIATARLLDRFGKGIRGAPRDAMISELAPSDIRGACFGLRQSLDTVGAVLGPLLAVGLLWWWNDNIGWVLWVAVLPGLVSMVLLLRLKEPTSSDSRPPRLPISRVGLASLGRPFWQLVALGMLIGLARFSEAFLVLRADGLGLSLTWIPLVLVVMSVVYSLSAYPAGVLSDRFRRSTMLSLGMLVLALAHVVLASASSPSQLFLGIALWGLHLGLSQGILASWVADTAPTSYRGTAFGVFNLAGGLALLVSSGTAGWLWDSLGPAAPFWLGAGLAVLAALFTLGRGMPVKIGV